MLPVDVAYTCRSFLTVVLASLLVWSHSQDPEDVFNICCTVCMVVQVVALKMQPFSCG